MTLPPLLVGENVRLTALSQDDIPEITSWYQDADFMRFFDSAPAMPRSEQQMKEWLEREQKNSHRNFLFGIQLIESENLIGIIELEGVRWTHRAGNLGIAIGKPEHRNKGWGQEAIGLLLAFAFDELNLHRVELTVFSYNEPAIHLYEKLGFTQDGAQREHLQRGGQRYDMLIYSMLEQEWRA